MIEQIVTDGKCHAVRCTGMDQESKRIDTLGSPRAQEIVPGRKYLSFESEHEILSGSIYRTVKSDGSVTGHTLWRTEDPLKFLAHATYSVPALPNLGMARFLDNIKKLAQQNWPKSVNRILDAALEGSSAAEDVVLEYATQAAGLGYHVILVDSAREGAGQVVKPLPFVQGRGMIRYESMPEYALGAGEIVLDADDQDKIWAAHCSAVKAARAAALPDNYDYDYDYYYERP